MIEKEKKEQEKQSVHSISGLQKHLPGSVWEPGFVLISMCVV